MEIPGPHEHRGEKNTHGHRKKMIIYKQRTEAKLANTLFLDFQLPEMQENSFMV